MIFVFFFLFTTTSIRNHIAGTDTTSTGLTATLYHLAIRPEVQEKALAEINQIMGNETSITAEHWEKMEYIRNVVSESLRLNPVVPAGQRLFDHEIVVAGYKIPANVPVGLNVWTTGQSPSYVHEPQEFKPERYNEESNGDLKVPLTQFTSATFGAGARMVLVFFEINDLNYTI